MRRQARQWALMMLYGIDMAGTSAERAVQQFFASFGDGEPIDPGPPWQRVAAYRVAVAGDKMDDARAFASDRVLGVSAGRVEIDQRIQEVSRKWRMARMGVVERNVLRLGAFEVLHRGEDVPRKVAINEAVELAKTFGDAGAGGFVNGILDRIDGGGAR